MHFTYECWINLPFPAGVCVCVYVYRCTCYWFVIFLFIVNVTVVMQYACIIVATTPVVVAENNRLIMRSFLCIMLIKMIYSACTICGIFAWAQNGCTKSIIDTFPLHECVIVTA